MSAIAAYPIDEARRLEVLHGLNVLDTPPEERFDRITRLASTALGVPIALVSLIDARRQWNKSCVGVEIRELPRAVSFCAHAIVSRDAFVIPDTHVDPRFAENPLVTGPPYIRFYAGQPLNGPEDQKLGTLCVADHRPRQLTADDRRLLRDLAGLVENELANVDLLEARREVERSHTELGRILDAARDGILRTTSDGTVRFVNPAAARLLDQAAEDLVGRPVQQVIRRLTLDGEPVAPEVDALTATLQDGQPRQVRRLVARPDGSMFPAELGITRVQTPAREDDGLVILLQDQSERREAERRIDELTGVVGHELRTPLTSIRGGLGLLDGGVTGPLPEPAAQLVRVALANAERLSRLIEDILDLERLRAGRTEFDFGEVAASAVIGETVQNVSGVAAAAGVTIQPQLDGDPRMCGDRLHLVQALTNLVGNAVKFSPPDREVEVCVHGDPDRVQFDVIDRGRGIPPEQLTRIFERFTQVESGDARTRSGTGLGLAIARSIVEHHGGEIWVTSTPGEGSTFSFTVPAVGGSRR